LQLVPRSQRSWDRIIQAKFVFPDYREGADVENLLQALQHTT
jgi:hypothetical protein